MVYNDHNSVGNLHDRRSRVVAVVLGTPGRRRLIMEVPLARVRWRRRLERRRIELGGGDDHGGGSERQRWPRPLRRSHPSSSLLHVVGADQRPSFLFFQNVSSAKMWNSKILNGIACLIKI